MSEPGKIWISDTTLRDGLQGYLIAFNLNDKIEIVRRLAEAGVPEIEIGVPSTSESITCLQKLVRAAGGAETMVLVRAREEDIDKAAMTGASRLDIVMGLSPTHLATKFNNMDPKTAVNRILTCMDHARKKGFQYIHIGIEDATRTPIEDLLFIAQKVADAGANRISLPDTVGTADHWEIEEMFRQVRAVIGPQKNLIAHCHNDLNMAVGNSLGAVVGGADTVSCTLAGIGERAGNTPVEALLFALHKKGYQTGIDVRKLVDATNVMLWILERNTGYTIAPNTAIIGSDVNKVHSGMHAAAILRNPDTYVDEGADISIIGKPPTVALGPTQGAEGIKSLLSTEYGQDWENNLGSGVVLYIINGVQKSPEKSYQKGFLKTLVKTYCQEQRIPSPLPVAQAAIPENMEPHP